jgi:rhodanese-related sulfurtransferase
MKRIFVIVMITVALLSISSCNGKAAVISDNQNNDKISNQGGYFNMKQDEAKRNLEEDSSIILIDVRTPQEYAEMHIPGSVLIPLDSIKGEAENKLANKEDTIYVYCRSGNRSASAAKILVELGYAKVYNIGGITTWPYETEKGEK